MNSLRIPYYQIDSGYYALEIEGKSYDITSYLRDNCHLVAYALAERFGYSIGVIVAQGDDYWYLIHTYAFYLDKYGTKYYVDVRGQDTSFEFIQSEFDTSGYNILEFTKDEAVHYFHQHNITLDSIGYYLNNIDYLLTVSRV